MTLGASSIEERLLSEANAGNLMAVIDIVSHTTISERELINPAVYDKVLFSISRETNDPVDRAYATMMFIRHVGRYVSPDTVSALLKKPEQAISAVHKRAG